MRILHPLAAALMGACMVASTSMAADPPQRAATPPRNIARDAAATASESQDAFTPDKALDGDPASRWSGIPGHNQGVWFQLDWREPVGIGELVIHQYDRFTMELDVQTWDERANDWRTMQHFGVPGRRLPSVVICRFEPVQTRRVRISNITNGPSFTEVEAYAEPFASGIVTRLASDLRGNIVGIVTDAFGGAGVANATVRLSGRVAHGAVDADWTASATSDANGLFVIPMPLALTGRIEIATTIGSSAAQSSAEACAFQYGLTPRGVGNAGAVELAGPWRFAPDPVDEFEAADFDDTGWSPIQVPSHWEMQGFHPIDGIGGYRTRFQAPSGGGRTILAFDGVYSGAQVWVNGVRVAAHEGGATPFECDITDAIHPGENVLALRVVEHTLTSDQLDKMSAYADFPLGGIMRRAWLLYVPDVHFGSLAVHTDYDPQSAKAVLSGVVTVLNKSDAPLAAGKLRVSLTDSEGRTLESASDFTSQAWSRKDVLITVNVERPRLWDAEHPNLYTLTLDVCDGDAVIQTIAQRVGFRQTTIRGSELLINGTPVKIRGTCHHDSDPLLGRAVTPELTRTDLTLIKRANMNALRTSHYPPIPELLEIADELGLYVEDEAPFCWVNVSDDLRNAPRIIQLTAELIARDRNHPSVFMWSLCNESGFGRSFELSRDWARAADPSRPLGAATSAWLDLATMHNPMSIAGIDQQEQLDKPLLWDESLAPFQGIWGDDRELWLDPGLRDYYGAPLRAVYDRMMRSRSVQGSLIWAWSDDIFCVPGRGVEYGRQGTRTNLLDAPYAMPGRGLAGDAPWGLVDGWRREKPEYWIVRKMHSPVRVSEQPLAIPGLGTDVRVPVENQYDFTDLNELRVTWRIGDEHGSASVASGQGGSSIPPRATGEIRFEPRRAVADGDVVRLTFADASGSTIDEFEIPFGSTRIELPPGVHGAARPLLIREEHTLAGHATRVIGADFELAIDRDTGRLRRCVAFGEPVLVELPAIHVLPTGQPLAPLGDPATWRLQSVGVSAEGESVRITIDGTYDRLAGRRELVLTPLGEIAATVSFEYTGPDFAAREIGTRLGVPGAMDRLEWSRRAEWNVYPDDHIGRPRGSAHAFAEHPAAVPPTWPWSSDNSPLGCNDFRSTKRNINWALLQHRSGAALQVISDGSQSCRATVETERIALVINDFYGGTGAGLGEWQGNYGTGQMITSGQRLTSAVHLRLARSQP